MKLSVHQSVAVSVANISDWKLSYWASNSWVGKHLTLSGQTVKTLWRISFYSSCSPIDISSGARPEPLKISKYFCTVICSSYSPVLLLLLTHHNKARQLGVAVLAQSWEGRSNSARALSDQMTSFWSVSDPVSTPFPRYMKNDGHVQNWSIQYCELLKVSKFTLWAH